MIYASDQLLQWKKKERRKGKTKRKDTHGERLTEKTKKKQLSREVIYEEVRESEWE